MAYIDINITMQDKIAGFFRLSLHGRELHMENYIKATVGLQSKTLPSYEIPE